MRFRFRHLLYVVTVFAVSLASGFPSTLFQPDEVWKVVSIHQEKGAGNDWRGLHPSVNSAMRTSRRDYIVTIQNGQRIQTVNLGDKSYVAEHRLQLPEIGGYVVLRDNALGSHGELPVVPVEAPAGIWSMLVPAFSLVCSMAFVLACLTIRWFICRQAFFCRERRMIDASLRAP